MATTPSLSFCRAAYILHSLSFSTHPHIRVFHSKGLFAKHRERGKERKKEEKNIDLCDTNFRVKYRSGLPDFFLVRCTKIVKID
jgi:hypothetical protein